MGTGSVVHTHYGGGYVIGGFAGGGEPVGKVIFQSLAK